MPEARREAIRLGSVSAVAILLLALASAAAGDTVRVKGDTLRGRVVELTSAGVRFAPVYGAGEIVVPYGDLEDVRTDGPLSVLYGDSGETHGRVVGFEEGQILIGDGPESAEKIDPASLFRAYPDEELGDSVYESLRSRLRFWSASLDAGGALVQSTTDRSSAFVAFRVERRKAPLRLLLDGSFRYATEKPSGEDRNVTENIVTGRVRGEYDLTDGLFGFASHRATYDEDQHLSYRLEPRAGLGMRILDRDTMKLSADTGIAYVYEDFFGSRGSNDFWSVAFGSEFLWKLAFGVVFRASGDYLPAVDDWAEDYLIRGESSLEFPLIEWLSFKVSVIDEYDNTPAEDSVRNKLTFTGGLSLSF